MPGRQLAVFLLCFGVLLTSGGAVAQDVKPTFNRSVDFTKYKKYTWGSNYLLTQQPWTFRNASTWRSSIPLTGICKRGIL